MQIFIKFYILYQILLWYFKSEMAVRKFGYHSAARRACDKTVLNQVWFIHILNGAAVFADCRG